MSSNPVVHLPLTYALGLLGACHRDGSLAVLFPSLVGDSARGCSIPLQKLKWLYYLSGLWSPLLCCKQIDNCHGTSIAWVHFSMRAEEIPWRDKPIIVVGFAILSKAHCTSILTIAVVRESCRYC